MNDTPTVYIPHLRMREDPLTKQRVSTINLVPASHFGTLSVCTSDNEALNKDNFAASVATIRAKMLDIQEGDFIAMTGDPTLCGVGISEALKHLDRITVLRWDHNRYIKLTIEA